MARLNTVIDEPTGPSSRQSQSQPKQQSNKYSSSATCNERITIDLTSPPRRPLSHLTSWSLTEGPEKPRRRLIRKPVVLLDSDEEGLRRRLGATGDTNGKEQDSESRSGNKQSIERTPPRQPFATIWKPSLLQDHRLGDNYYHSSAEEVRSDEDESSPPPSSEGSGDVLGSEDTNDEDEQEGEGGNEDPYDSSFVVSDSFVEYDSGGEIEKLLDAVDRLQMPDEEVRESKPDVNKDRGGRQMKTVGEREIEWEEERIKERIKIRERVRINGGGRQRQRQRQEHRDVHQSEGEDRRGDKEGIESDAEPKEDHFPLRVRGRQGKKSSRYKVYSELSSSDDRDQGGRLRGFFDDEAEEASVEEESESDPEQVLAPRVSKSSKWKDHGKVKSQDIYTLPRALATVIRHRQSSEDEDSGEFNNLGQDAKALRGAMLSYFPPTAKPLVRTPISSPIAPKTKTRNPSTAPALTPHKRPQTPRGKQASPTKPIGLLPFSSTTTHDIGVRTPSALRSFQSRKYSLATTFLEQLDKRVAHGQVFSRLTSVGGLPIHWSKTLLTTAGQFRYRHTISNRDRVDCDGEHLPGPPLRVITWARIELAEKVVDDEDRLYNTLAHEFAHAADLVVGENWEQRAHGKGFTTWLSKCKREFPEYLIEVGSCHQYAVNYKYHWVCIGVGPAPQLKVGGVENGCGHVVKRHSKSVDVSIHRCPVCGGRLVQTLPKPRGGGGDDAVAIAGVTQGQADTGGISEYQLFVKERMGIVKKANPGTPQKDLMRLVGQEWRERKEKKMAGNERRKDNGPKVQAKVVEISDDESEDEKKEQLDDIFGGLRL